MNSPITNSRKIDSESFTITIEHALNEATKGLSVELLNWMKQKFESNMQYLINENLGDITVGIVTDSSSVIRALNYYAKGKTSRLFKLAKNPIFPLYAPPKLEEEVLDYINNKAKKKYSKKKLQEGWEKLRTVITIKEIQNDESTELAKKIMTRDPNDVSFVSMVIDTGAMAVLSEDNDFVPSIQRFTTEKFGDIIGIYHKGLFSFFIMTDFVPLIIELAGKLVLGVISILFEFLGIVVNLSKSIISGSFNALSHVISRIPSWVLVLIGVAALLVIILHDGTRKKVSTGLKSLWNTVKPIIEKIISWLLNALEKLLNYTEKASPYLGMSVITINELHKNIIEFSNEIKNIKLENSAHFS